MIEPEKIEKGQKEYERDEKLALQHDLESVFFDFFNKYQFDFPLDYIYSNFLVLDNRKEVIKETSQNSSVNADYLDDIYKKTLKKVYNQFLDDKEARAKLGIVTPEEKAKIEEEQERQLAEARKLKEEERKRERKEQLKTKNTFFYNINYFRIVYNYFYKFILDFSCFVLWDFCS